MQFVQRLAVIAIFLGGFLVGGAYIRFLDTIDGYNADMVQDAITRLEQVQQKYQEKVDGNIMVQPVVQSGNIMVQP